MPLLRLLHDASVCWLVIRCRANLINYVYCQIQLVALYNFAVPHCLISEHPQQRGLVPQAPCSFSIVVKSCPATHKLLQ